MDTDEFDLLLECVHLAKLSFGFPATPMLNEDTLRGLRSQMYAVHTDIRMKQLAGVKPQRREV